MFRPNLQNEDHRKAWEILQSVPEGQKSAFLVRAILATEQQRELEATLRRGCCGKNSKLFLPSQYSLRRKRSHRR